MGKWFIKSVLWINQDELRGKGMRLGQAVICSLIPQRYPWHNPTGKFWGQWGLRIFQINYQGSKAISPQMSGILGPLALRAQTMSGGEGGHKTWLRRHRAVSRAGITTPDTHVEFALNSFWASQTDAMISEINLSLVTFKIQSPLHMWEQGVCGKYLYFHLFSFCECKTALK